jgi:class 3 adenylate cyclase
MRDEDYPWGSSPEERERLLATLRDGSFDPTEMMMFRVAPREMADPSFRQWWRMHSLSAITAPEAYDAVVALGPVDIRRLLGSIRVPTLLLHRAGDRFIDVHTSRYMAQRIPGARLVELPGDDHFPFLGDQDAVVALTQEFLTGALPVPDPDRMLATVLFTDIVGSTRLATELGDRRWHRTLEVHNRVVRANLARFRGREVKTTGDGFLASFDGPARAIRAAHAIRAELAEHRLQIRVGLHTGEVELVGDDVGGIAVHIAARVMAQTGAGEVLCSRTVKDLVAGAGFTFDDRGSRRLKGVPDRWQLYAVSPPSASHAPRLMPSTVEDLRPRLPDHTCECVGLGDRLVPGASAGAVQFGCSSPYIPGLRPCPRWRLSGHASGLPHPCDGAMASAMLAPS